MSDIPKAYEAKHVEEKWYAHWLEKGTFHADPQSKKPAYSIVIPPPNVTGVLTMGHVLNNTLQDILARRKRMQGFEVLWLPGTDHAGIATQTVVEKTLRKQKVIRHRDDLGRDKFLEKVWEWKDKHGGIIIQQLKKLGCSCDWSRERFTMDEAYSRCVLQVFVELHRKGNIYRGKRMVNWCPVSRTALSDEEVIMKEVDGHLWHIKYPIVEESEERKNGRMEAASAQPSSLPPIHPSKFLVVATTRPETMLGDEAVAVNPNDERYQKLVGRELLLPLKNKRIPVIADAAVDPKFGTGCVKVTPAHDPADYEMALRHKLPFTVVIGYDGVMTDEAGEPFAGLDRAEARAAVVKELEEDGLLLKVEPYKHNVGYSERADVPVEPMISEQWFMKYPCAEKSRAAVATGDIKFYPERWARVYDHWLGNIRDWCISRQLWWGHRIPVWYRKTQSSKPSSADIYVGIEPPPDPQNWEQDPDVLDTWFSSWLWPFATMGWPEKTETLTKFYPTADLVTAPDIIFFWVARMIMAGHEFMGEKPFSNVYFTGIIRDAIGRKMSKSLGNSPDPLDLIARYGADGLRFGLMLIAPQGQDILFDEKRMELGRNFCNKLWNACRLRQMQEEGSGFRGQGSGHGISALNPQHLSSDDRFILLQLDATIREVNRALDAYEFNAAAQALYQFFWSRYCDWYLEASKSVLWGTDADRKANTLMIMDIVLSNVLRLLHPYMPFITEELWQGLGYSADAGAGSGTPGVASTIMFANWPSPLGDADKSRLGLTDEVSAWVESKYALIGVGRNLRSEYQVAPGKKVRFIIRPNDAKIAGQLQKDMDVIALLLTASEVQVDAGFAAKQGTPTGVEKPGTIYMPLEGAVDLVAEKARLTKELDRARKDLEFVEAKLNNPSFRDRAPAPVVKAQEAKRAEIQERLQQLETAIRALS